MTDEDPEARFEDAEGREWSLKITVNDIRRVRRILGEDLLKDNVEQMLSRLMADPVLLVDVIYVLVKPQADNRDLSDEDFGRSLYGDALDRATQAFLDALTNFFPSRRREILRRVRERAEEVTEKMAKLTMEQMESGELEKAIEREMKQIRGEQSADSPESQG